MFNPTVGQSMLIGAGLNFASGLLGGSGGGKAARQQLQHQLFLDRESRDWNLQRQAEQYDWMREDRAREDRFIQRRVADAKAAGLHPLFALGASSGGSPSFMAGQSTAGTAAAASVSESPLGRAARAAARGFESYARSKAMEKTELDIREQQARVDLAELEVQAARRAAAAAMGTGPRPTPQVEDVPFERPYSGVRSLGQEGGWHVGGLPSADEVEQMYGEAAGVGYGLGKGVYDLSATARGAIYDALPKEYKHLVRPWKRFSRHFKPKRTHKPLTIRIRKARGGEK